MKLLLILSLLVCIVSFIKRNDFPQQVQLDSRILQEPLQSKSYKDDISLPFKDHEYWVKPQYRYELYGLVVSYRLHDGDKMLHKSWGDHLNVADLCVIWSETAQSPWLNSLRFWNGQFTCNVSTRSNEAWQSFNMNQLSNNHLISADDVLRDRIANVEIGDQIRITGWLAEYGSEQGKIRGTSIRRDDTGNGACETLYVERFEVIQQASSPWRMLWYGSLACFLLFALLYLLRPFKPND